MMSRLLRTLILASALNLLVTVTAAATDIRDSVPTLARISTNNDQSPADNDANDAFKVRVYDNDFAYADGRHNWRPVGREIVAIDVTNYLAICPNGQAKVRAITLGSWQFDLDGECAGDEMSADITVVWGRMLAGHAPAAEPDPR